jgi:uncharacterized protein YndB with AHSA1/START domain
MRWFKWIALTVLVMFSLVLAGLYLARFRPSYGHIEVSVEIAAPLKTVFALISRPENAKKWITDLTEVRTIDPGKNGIGARDRVVMMMDGERNELELQVTAIDPLLRLEMDEWPIGNPSMDFRAHVVYKLRPTATGTVVTESSRTEYKTALGRLLEPIITRAATEALTRYLNNLKRVAEAQQPARN